MTRHSAPINSLDHAEYLLAQRDLATAQALFSQQPPSDRTDAGLWQCAMLLGHFESAWCATDRIRDRNAPDPHRFWQREPIAGRRVILRCLHGLGDAFQFLRYLPLLNSVTKSVILEIPPRLAPLARHLAGATRVITWDDPPPTWDVQVEIMELPYLFRTQPADLPLAQHYLTPILSPADRRTTQSQPLPPTSKLRVGLVGNAGRWNQTRSISESLLLPLLQTPNTEFWSLHPNPTSLPLREYPNAQADLFTLAEHISQLDLVLTVDTLAAHLAGALGIRAWVLLQYAADWRWQHLRTDSPWYPAHRLFRQPTPGDWPAVIQAVTSALRSEVSLSPSS